MALFLPGTGTGGLTRETLPSGVTFYLHRIVSLPNRPKGRKASEILVLFLAPQWLPFQETQLLNGTKGDFNSSGLSAGELRPPRGLWYPAYASRGSGEPWSNSLFQTNVFAHAGCTPRAVMYVAHANGGVCLLPRSTTRTDKA